MIAFRPKDQISVAAGPNGARLILLERRDARRTALPGGISSRKPEQIDTARSNGGRATGAAASSTCRPTIGTNSFRCRREPIRSKSGHPPGPESLDRLHDAAQFRQALEAADERIAGVDALLPSSPSRCPWSGRIGISASARPSARRRSSSVISAATRRTMSVSPARWSASKNEPSGSRLTLRRWAKCTRGPNSLRHGDDIVLRVRAERAGAERHPVGVGGHGGKQLAQVIGGRHDPRQAKDRERRIVGMDGEAHALLLGDGGDLAHERDEIGAQAFDRRRPCRASARLKLSRS